MGTSNPGSIVDVTEVRSRLDSLGAGWRLAAITTAAGWGYAAATLARPARLELALLFALSAAVATVVVLMPAERIVRSRWREPFFLVWALVNVGVIAAAVAIDGAGSPLALLFFLPLLFAALSYPLTSVAIVGALTQLSYVGTALGTGYADNVRLGFFSVCLGAAAVVCAWHARNQDLRRDELALVSRTDPLTGCFNRRGFQERLEAEFSLGPRRGQPMSLLVLDLDGLKNVNDRRGHPAGDDVLCWVAQTLEEVKRPIDVVARLGGDEFALVLPDTVKQDAQAVADRLQEALAARAPASIGVASFPEDGSDDEALHRAADTDMYAHKRSDRNGGVARSLQLSWATAFADAVDRRMAAAHEHSWSVADHAAGTARGLGWSEEQIEQLRLAAVLHDIGKVNVPDRILQKPGPLEPEEFEEMANHPVSGARMLERIDGLEGIAPWVLHSHERYDGSGYPDGLAGEAIPQASRILLVADAFDAMTSHRPYQAALSYEDALEELHRNAGTQFDPACVEAFEAHLADAPAARDGHPA